MTFTARTTTTAGRRRENGAPDTDTIDTLAAMIAADALGSPGGNERSGRLELAGLVVRAGLARAVAFSWLHAGRTATDIEDLAEGLSELLMTKIVGVPADDNGPGREPTLALEHIAAGRSLCGWARQLATTAARSEWRRIERRRAHFARVFIDATGEDADERPLGIGAVGLSGCGSPDADVLDDAVGPRALERAEEMLDSYRARSHNLRSAARVHLQAATVCRWLGAEAPPRLVYAANAGRLRALLESDETVARDWLAGRREAPKLLPAALGSMPVEAQRKLADMPAVVSATVALSAVTPRPPLSQALCSELVKQVAGQLSSVMAPEVARRKARTAVARFVEAHAELARSEYAGGQREVKSAARFAADVQRWQHSAEALARLGPLGHDACSVTATLARAVEELSEQMATAAA